MLASTDAITEILAETYLATYGKHTNMNQIKGLKVSDGGDNG